MPPPTIKFGEETKHDANWQPPTSMSFEDLGNMKSQKTNAMATENTALQKKSDYLNSPLGVATETTKGTVKNLVSGGLTFLKSAIHAPVDIARGLMGKAPETDNTGLPTIQAQATQRASDVYDLKQSPVSATADLVGQTVSGAADVLGAEGLLKPTKAILDKGATEATKAYESYQTANKAKQAEQATQKVTGMISPKPTVKEAKLAQTQGRLIQGKEPSLFRGGTEDQIMPSKKTLSASQTIVNNVPNASKMKPSELYQAVDSKIKETATKLRPQMEATPIKPDTIQKLNTDWEQIKKTQLADAPATEEPNVLKRQNKFEEFLKKSGAKNHADLWDTRIAYDDSIPDSVKKANSISSESLQLQKEEWLQNRNILNQAIDSTGKPEFKIMSDLYEAKNGLLSKTKVNGAQMSKANQFLKDNPKISAALGGATIYEIAKHSGVPLP